MTKKWLHIIAVLMLVSAVGACKPFPANCVEECDNGQHCQKKCGEDSCIDADDWGYPRVWVPASGMGVDASGVLQPPQGAYPRQTAFPVNSNQKLLNAADVPLVIATRKRDQWTSWFGGEINSLPNGAPNPDGWDGGRVVPNRECQYHITNGTQDSSGGPKDDLSPATIWADFNDPAKKFYMETLPSAGAGSVIKPIGGAAAISKGLFENTMTTCYYRYGMGLYVGLAPGGSDVDKSSYSGFTSARSSDVIFSYHIPDSKKPGVALNRGLDDQTNTSDRRLDGYLVRGYAKDELPGAQTGDTLFFKIVDNYYDDNTGGYIVKIKEGTRNPQPGILESAINMVLDPVFVVMRRVYEGIVDNPMFINTVRAALGLYIVFYGYLFIIGGIEEAKKKAAVRILKIAIIIQVISPDSWDFFYNHLFALFIEGSTEIAGLLMSPFDGYDPAQPWYAMDNFLNRTFSEATQAKIWSTLFSNWAGFIIVLALFFALALFLWALFKAVMLYLTAMIGMAILVVMAPIFIIFILFDKTKQLFDEVLSQFMATSIEIILLMASLGMFAAIIIMFMERTLGYNVCYNTVWDFDLFGIRTFHIEFLTMKFWLPDIGTDMANIWMDIDGNGVRDINPPELAYRYIDLPYLDPIVDQSIIERYMRETNFLDPKDIGIFVAAVFLMYSFISFVPSIANLLKSGGQGTKQSTSMFGGGSGMNGALFNTFAQTAGSMFNFSSWATMKAGGFGAAQYKKATTPAAERPKVGGAASTTANPATGGAATKGIKSGSAKTGNMFTNTLKKANDAGSYVGGKIDEFTGVTPSGNDKPKGFDAISDANKLSKPDATRQTTTQPDYGVQQSGGSAPASGVSDDTAVRSGINDPTGGAHIESAIKEGDGGITDKTTGLADSVKASLETAAANKKAADLANARSLMKPVDTYKTSTEINADIAKMTGIMQAHAGDPDFAGMFDKHIADLQRMAESLDSNKA